MFTWINNKYLPKPTKTSNLGNHKIYIKPKKRLLHFGRDLIKFCSRMNIVQEDRLEEQSSATIAKRKLQRAFNIPTLGHDIRGA